MPHRSAQEAVAFALEHSPELPAAPSIPVARPMESMVAQAAWAIAGVSVHGDASISVDGGALDPDAPLDDPGLCGPPFATLQAFLSAVAERRRPIKLQLTGPVTLGCALREEGVADELAFRIAGEAVRRRALHLVGVARCRAPEAALVVFLDEPALADGARFGAMLETVLGTDRTIDLVSGALAALEPHAVTGLHCCGPTDWRAVLQAGPQVVSLPAGGGITTSAGALGAFLDRGGWVAWGVVPTDGPIGDHPSSLWRHLSSQWCELAEAGCDPATLRSQALLTPVCGLASHGQGQAERVMQLTRAMAERLRDQVLAVRFSVGA